MVTMNILRMLVDASFFYSIAGIAAATYGGSGAFAGALIQCLVFGIASAAGKRRALRLILLLPMGICWYIYRDSLADCILMIPVALYILFVTAKGDYVLQRERQSRIFSFFWRAMAVFAPLAMVTGSAPEVTGITLPFAMMTLTGSVLLMRALRHEERVYCEKKYQIVNLSTVALAVAAAYFLSSEAVLNGFVSLVKAIYRYLILPVLLFLLKTVAFAFFGVVDWLFSFIRLEIADKSEELEPPEINFVDIPPELTEYNAESLPAAEQVWNALLIIAAIVLIFLFFRWLMRRGADGVSDSRQEGNRTFLPREQGAAPKRDNGPIRTIRAQYRKFLKLCAEHGAPPEKSSTSQDMNDKASSFPDLRRVSGEIRDIYILARYAGKADQESVRRMKKLCAEAKKRPDA